MRHHISLFAFASCLCIASFASAAPPPAPDDIDVDAGTPAEAESNGSTGGTTDPQMCPVKKADLDACNAAKQKCEGDLDYMIEKNCNVDDAKVLEIMKERGFEIEESGDGLVECKHGVTGRPMRGKDDNSNGYCDGTGKRKKRDPKPPKADDPSDAKYDIEQREERLEPGHILCPHGGWLISLGKDANENNTLDESEDVIVRFPSCDGAPGEAGAQGETGGIGPIGPAGENGKDGEGLGFEAGVNYRYLYLQASAKDRPDGQMLAPEVTVALRSVTKRFGVMFGLSYANGEDGGQSVRLLGLYRVSKRVTLRFGGEVEYWATNAPPGEQSGTAVWDTKLVSGGLELTLKKTDHFRLACGVDLLGGDDGYDEMSQPAIALAANCGLSANP